MFCKIIGFNFFKLNINQMKHRVIPISKELKCHITKWHHNFKKDDMQRFGSKNSFLDHANRRGLLLKYKCSFCSQNDVLLFYNPCSFLLHARQHFSSLIGQIDLEKLEICVLPIGLAGFLPDPSIPLLYDVRDDEVEETTLIDSKFYSPIQETMGHPIVKFIPNEILFMVSSESRSITNYLLLRQISSYIPRCRFVYLNESIIEVPSGNKQNSNESLVDNEENNTQIKEEPVATFEENNTQLPIITKVETIREIVNDNSIKFPSCPECGEVQTMPMVEHFLNTNKPFQENLKCSICKYIAPTKCSLQAHERIHDTIAPFVCPECGKNFDTWKLLHMHLEEVCFHLTKQVRLRCPGRRCGKIFAQIVTFSSHFLMHMRCLSKCSGCNIIFLSLFEFQKHAEMHEDRVLPINMYKCSVCSNETEYFCETNYQNHIYEHANNRTQCLYVYICKHCHSYFRSTTTYATHLLRCYKLYQSNAQILFKRSPLFIGDVKQRRKSYALQVIGSCPSCSTQIKAQSQDIENINIKCPTCHEPFDFEMGKKNNIPAINNPNIRKMDDTVKTLRCLLCKELLTKKELQDHISRRKCKFHNPIVVLQSDLVSDTCETITIQEEVASPRSDDGVKKKRRRSSVFSPIYKARKLSMSNSENDLSIVPDEPIIFDGTYYCKLCDYNNTDRNQFQNHIILHRNVSTAYQCMDCGECFVVKPSLIKHLLYYHQIINVDEYFEENDCFDKKAVKELEEMINFTPREYNECVAENQCRVCLQQFSSPSELNTHFRIHGMAFLLKNSKQLRD